MDSSRLLAQDNPTRSAAALERSLKILEALERKRPQFCIAWVTAPPVAVRAPSTTYCAPVIAEAKVGAQEQDRIGDLVGCDIAADRDRRPVAPADTRRVGRVELGFERMDHRVSTGPGQTALTRMPCRAISPAAALVSPMTACFEAT